MINLFSRLDHLILPCTEFLYVVLLVIVSRWAMPLSATPPHVTLLKNKAFTRHLFVPKGGARVVSQ